MKRTKNILIGKKTTKIWFYPFFFLFSAKLQEFAAQLAHSSVLNKPHRTHPYNDCCAVWAARLTQKFTAGGATLKIPGYSSGKSRIGKVLKFPKKIIKIKRLFQGKCSNSRVFQDFPWIYEP